MITEDYVSFEIAKLLKEKGFEEGCRQYWYKGNIVFSRNEIRNGELDNYEDKGWTAPTLQMVMKWLREVHKIYMYVAHDSMENTWFARVYNDYKTLSDVDNHSTYEEAAEAAIRYILENLI